MLFYEELKRARKNKGLSQQDLADRLDVTRQTVYRWENGTAIPYPENIKLLCDVLDHDLIPAYIETEKNIEQESESLSIDKKEEIACGDDAKCKRKGGKRFLPAFFATAVLFAFSALAAYIIHGMAFSDNVGDIRTVNIYVDKSIFYIVLSFSILLLATAVTMLFLMIKTRKQVDDDLNNKKEQKGETL